MVQGFDNIIKTIKYFIDTKRYGVVDRMALAMSPESVETALYDMLRLIDSLEARSIRVKIKVKDKDYEVKCCEYGDKLGYGIHGLVLDAEREDLNGKNIYCMPCPPRPSVSEITSFLETVNKDPSIARKLVIKAFGHYG